MPVSEAFLLEHDMLQKLKRKKTAFRCRLKEGLSQETVYEIASRHNHTGLDLPPLERMEFQGSGSCYRLPYFALSFRSRPSVRSCCLTITMGAS